jgi:hypothetical protein
MPRGEWATASRDKRSLSTGANDPFPVVENALPVTDVLFACFSEMDDSNHLPRDASRLLNPFVDGLVKLDFCSDSIQLSGVSNNLHRVPELLILWGQLLVCICQ